MQQNKLYGLDHLRAVAIVLVFVYHYGRLFPHPDWVFNISKFGWTGVDLFFVLSGYLIASQLFKEVDVSGGITLKHFYIKRFFRIIPAYLLVVALYFCLPVTHEREGLAPLWRYLTFTQNYGLDLRYHGTFSHAWSLCIEEQFYLLLPFTLVALLLSDLYKKGYWLIPVMFVAGAAVRWWAYTYYVAPTISEGSVDPISWYKYIYYPTYTRLDGLLTGITIAAVFNYATEVKQKADKYGNYLLLAGLLVLVVAWFICEEQLSLTASVWGFLVVSMGYGLLVAGTVSSSSVLYRFKSGVTAQLAKLSYGLYLIHKIVIHLTQLWLGDIVAADSTLMFLLCIVTTIVAAYALYLLIEKPFMLLRNRFV
jgi:peptidoglycan/LPS O-acetylase OafA/YrhL